ncbi:FkbM family methyltransferase [Burkholderia dolosa]|uniref:FkbM family methyltransferase n=1 Tax=Burkholderia dolosa TaxID=152500 RepID=UPI00159051E1|nr:FkbM family methyltransferase [Burkholderia dolosa]MBY4755798.1 FkbM family methyltransferase [Burkholderia dolosa]
MKIPFALHRKIPQIRRVLEQRDQAIRDVASLHEELARLRHRNEQLESLIAERAKPQYPFLFGDADARMGETAKRIWSLMRPMDVVGKRLIRMGRPHDGGYIMVDHALHGAIAYSLGINDDVSWDLDMAELGCQIFQYDHTIAALPYEHPNFHWSKKGIAARQSTDGTLDRLDDLIAQNGHSGRRDLILKMDIEGFEWEVFEAMEENTLQQFSQIVLEVHSLVLGGAELQSRIANVLAKLYRYHQPVHVHANNHGYLGIVGGVAMPDTMELSYVRRADHQFTMCHRMFPSDFDTPCRIDVPDFYLGPLGALPEVDLEERRISD